MIYSFEDSFLLMCFFVYYYVFNLFIFLGLKFRNSRQLSNEEKALLLIENLQTDDHFNLVNSMAFPCAIANIQYFRLLEFDRNDQKELLEKLRPLATPVNLMVFYIV